MIIIELLVLEDVEKMKRKIMQSVIAKEFDKKFDNGEDISQYLDFSKSIKVNDFEKKITKTKKINVDFPETILVLLDKEAHTTKS